MGYVLLGIGCLSLLVVSATVLEAHRQATRNPGRTRR
ncbi:hypothetical protein BXY66_1734 [Shimia isoporae]|uniref:Uncharacterized protein n=1 Tax=Shimia isoporae TaxID=647720 RepID=A0A4R1NWM0_9RHOB|nr:hypothetical protein BXY66_1734 [Shimia isoporae]